MRTEKFTVEVGAEVYEFDTSEELGIDRDNLDEAMKNQAALYAWFYVKHEEARAYRVTLEGEYEDLKYQTNIDEREKAAASGAKLTEEGVKAKVGSNARVIAQRKKIERAEQNERLLAAMVSAFSQRKDLIIALARSRNAEQSTFTPAEIDKIKENLGG